MLVFDVPDISCGHCVQAVTQAIHRADPGAQVQVDLGSKQVRVQSAQARAALVAALDEAGYTPQDIAPG